MTVEVVSLGCRLNLSESEAMRAMLSEAGDMVVINSCAVTSEAVRQTRQAIRRARRERDRSVLGGRRRLAQVDDRKHRGRLAQRVLSHLDAHRHVDVVGREHALELLAVEVDDEATLAAWRVEQFTTMPVPRITGRWAGLRSFVKDRMPVAGFAPDAPGFFWLAGQGGFGLQTSPAMSALAAALVTGSGWPEGMTELGVTPESVSVERLRA